MPPTVFDTRTTGRPASAIALGLMALAVTGRPAALGADDPAALTFGGDIRPLLEHYCHRCHGGDRPKGDVDLSQFENVGSIIRASPLWRRVIEQLEAGEMPPEDKPQPTDEERAQLVGWVRHTLENIDWSQIPQDPGRPTIRRLNRTEYDNTVRDLFGLALRPARNFPADGSGGEGFDNNADTLFVPPLLLERYLAAAGEVLDQVVVTPPFRRHFPAASLTSTGAVKGAAGTGAGAAKTEPAAPVTFSGRSQLLVPVHLPREGKYAFRVRAAGERRDSAAPRMELRVGEERVGEFIVTARPGEPFDYEAEGTFEAGAARLAVVFTNPEEDNDGRPQRILYVDAVDVVEVSRRRRPTPAHRRLFISHPGDGPAPAEAARKILQRFTRRAFRRPVEADEVDRLVALFEDRHARGASFEEAVQLALKTVLVSPHFLFRAETPAPGADAPYPVDDHAYATRLSYFLWSSMPDDELFALADKGALNEPGEIRRQVKRMLADPRARSLANDFAAQWLGFRELRTTSRPDKVRFPEFTLTLRASMYREAVAFAHHILAGDRSVLELIDADYTFLNEPLANHYGIGGVRGAKLQKVALTDRNRGGVLGLGGVLVATSEPLRTSPVKRGRWVLDDLLGTPPPPPPQDAGVLPADDVQPDGLSFRQRLELHRRKPDCAGCHNRIDPIGFGLENFDPIGRWREEAAGGPIDTSGVLPDGTRFDGPAELKAYLLDHKDEFAHHLARKLLAFALGRGLEFTDEPALQQITRELAQNNYRSSTLITEVALSYPMRYARVPGEGAK